MFKGFRAIRDVALGIVFLRRISRSLYKIDKAIRVSNDLKELELEFKYPQQMKTYRAEAKRKAAQTGERKPLEISVGSYERWNSNWKETHAPGYDPDTDDLNG